MSQPYPPQGGPNQPPNGPSQPDYGQPSSSGSATSGGYAPSNYSETPYGGQSANPPAEPQGYGSAPQQGYQPAYGYGPGTPATANRKPTMGITALLLTVFATIGYCIFSVLTAGAMVDLVEILGTSNVDTTNIESLPPPAQDAAIAMTGFMFAQAIPALMGLVGFILGIVATATNRGRVWGIFAIVLGVLGPVIGFIVFSMGLAPIAGV